MNKLQHDLDLANSRIKELEAINVALIAERDLLRAASRSCAECERLSQELAELNSQEPVAYWWKSISKSSSKIVREIGFYPSIAIAESGLNPLYSRPVPAIPEGIALVPRTMTEDIVDAIAKHKSCGAYCELYDAIIAAAQKGGA